MVLIMIGFVIGCVVGGFLVLTMVCIRMGRRCAEDLESKFSIPRCSKNIRTAF